MKLLHLEDEGPLRDVFRSAINQLDDQVEVIQFISGDDAWEYIKENIDDISVFILDVRVPGKLDGMALAKQIRELGNTRPIVITSAYIKPDRLHMKDLQLEWMPKPLHILNLAQKILPWVQDKA